MNKRTFSTTLTERDPMKTHLIQIALTLAAALCARGQGTILYDQQSVTNEIVPAGIVTPIQTQQPFGQSFVPSFSTIGLIRVYLSDQSLGGVGATVDINLWSGSIGNGTLISSTHAMFLMHGFFGYTNFFFSAPVPVSPGTTYFFQPFVESGDSDNGMVTGLTERFNYPAGAAIISGSPSSGFDLLFREGIEVPEPSSVSLAILGLVGLFAALRRRA